MMIILRHTGIRWKVVLV